MSGTLIAYGAMGFRARYAMSDTRIAYAATLQAVLTSRTRLPRAATTTAVFGAVQSVLKPKSNLERPRRCA
eukprot:1517193-Rhodomonas_salina.1